MKSYTSIKQAKTLAEFLLPISADMSYKGLIILDKDIPYNIPYVKMKELRNLEKDMLLDNIIPCWSLAALMDVLDRGILFKTPQGWVCQAYPEHKAITSNYHSDPVNACYEMILNLHERKML